MQSSLDLFGRAFWPIASGALVASIPLALASMAIGLVIALVVAMMRLSGRAWLSGLARFYTSVIRGTPLLVQLFVVFYGLPSIGLRIDPWPSAIIAFSLNVGGYAAEVIRAAILSVPKGQWEAAHTIGTRDRAVGPRAPSGRSARGDVGERRAPCRRPRAAAPGRGRAGPPSR